MTLISFSETLTFSYCFSQNHKSQSLFSTTAFIKSSVIRTEQLKYRRTPSCSLAVIKSSISGEDISRHPIWAPRREPPDIIVEQIVSNIFIKEITPEVEEPAPNT